MNGKIAARISRCLSNYIACAAGLVIELPEGLQGPQPPPVMEPMPAGPVPSNPGIMYTSSLNYL